MSRMVVYSDTEKEIVRKGFDAVESVLIGNDMASKERLLFCLDYYMDPYYKAELTYEAELIELLEKVIVSTNSMEVKEDALSLLIDYTCPPYSILQSKLDEIESGLIGDVKYAINRQEIFR